MVLASGLDNMIVVLRAIAGTDVNLPVPRRMSSGLRRVGAEMTILLVIEELMALGLLWWVEITVSLCIESRDIIAVLTSGSPKRRSCESGSASEQSSLSSTTFSSSLSSRPSCLSTFNVLR